MISIDTKFVALLVQQFPFQPEDITMNLTALQLLTDPPHTNTAMAELQVCNKKFYYII